MNNNESQSDNAMQLENMKKLRTRLFDLFAEQKKWQKQLQDVGENMTFDDVHHQIKWANDKIAKHQKIIARCENFEKKTGKNRMSATIEEADNDEYVLVTVIDQYTEPNFYYSIEHSQKRIAFWKDEISKYEQKLQMMEIAQQQIDDLTLEIADINEQLKNATTGMTSESLEEESSNKIESMCIPQYNKTDKIWIYTDKATCEDKERFEEHIKYLCKNGLPASKIKHYILTQEKEYILEHINLTMQYNLLKEMGVNFKKKTYLNA